LDSMCNWGCRVFIHSNLMATSSPVEIFVPKKKITKIFCGKWQQIIQFKYCLHVHTCTVIPIFEFI